MDAKALGPAVLAGAAVVGARAVVGVGKAAIGAVTDLTTLGAAIAETQSKFNTIFGAQSTSLNKWAGEFSAVAGVTASESQKMLSHIGNIAQGVGLTGEALRDFSQDALSLAGDLGSFNPLPNTPNTCLLYTSPSPRD